MCKSTAVVDLPAYHGRDVKCIASPAHWIIQPSSYSFQRPIEGSSGCPKFVPLSVLDNSSYIKDDTIILSLPAGEIMEAVCISTSIPKAPSSQIKNYSLLVCPRSLRGHHLDRVRLELFSLLWHYINLIGSTFLFASAIANAHYSINTL